MHDAIKVIIESVPTNSPDLINIFSGLLTPILAIIAAYIAWRQHYIDKNRLKNELYDRRAAVFTELDLFLNDFIREGYTTYERTHKLYNQIAKSKFLFKKKTQNYLLEIYHKCIRCYELQLKLNLKSGEGGLPVGEERSKVANEQCEIQKWVSAQSHKSINEFKEYFEIN